MGNSAVNPTKHPPAGTLAQGRRRRAWSAPRRLGSALLLLAIVAPAAAEASAHLVRNIDEARRGRIRRCPLSSCPLPEPVYGSLPTRIVPFGDRVILGADDGIHGLEPWISDGTEAGTVLLANLSPGIDDSAPVPLGIVNGRLLFWAGGDLDGFGSWTLYATDGTSDGTFSLGVPCGGKCELPLGGPLHLEVDGLLYFSAFDWDLRQEALFRTDGSGPAERVRTACNGVGSCVFEMVELVEWNDDVLLVEGIAGGGARRVVSVGGSSPVPMLAQCGSAGRLTPLGDDLLFAGSCDVTRPGGGLWALSPGAAAPRLVHELGEGEPVSIARAAGGVVVGVEAGTAATAPERRLWLSNGTASGTRPLATFRTISATADLGSRLLVAGTREAGQDARLWRVDLDGSVGLVLGQRITTPFAVHAGRAYFAARDAAHGVELWRSDGTTGGTALVADIHAGAESSNPGESGFGPSGFAIANGRLFFAADHPTWDIELWALELPGDGPPPLCTPADDTLCLGGNRFRVRATWRTADGASGSGTAIPLESNTGAFWFFDATNYELMVKVLDACQEPWSRYWFFASGLTNVETSLWVEDLVAQQSRQYHNALGTVFQPIQDTAAFDTCP
jgi:ELWxxDGT repeat protein